MRPWYEIAIPHKDIREERLDTAVFTAALGEVVQNRGELEYRDPQIFFNRTYITKGIKSILLDSLAHLSGKSKHEAVIQIETPFGGGKTHTLLCLYHLFNNSLEAIQSDNVKELINELGMEEIPKVKVAIIVGTDLDPLKGRTTPDGIIIKTLWGEIGYQLGGLDGFNLVKEHDERGIAPGKEKLGEILQKSEPNLILMDEILEYGVKALKIESQMQIKGQILAFFQEFSEAIANLSRSQLFITIPSRHLERYDESSEKLFRQIGNIFGRVENIRTPVEGDEIFEIVRRRLFEEIKDQDYINQTAGRYFKYYLGLKSDIPQKTNNVLYREQIKRSYPFHPEIIKILYERWGTLPNFQRTRGVLRLLALVIADLYKSQRNIELINAGNINLGNVAIKRELLQFIGDQYEAAIKSDISDPLSKASMVDKELGSEFEPKKIATQIATTIFFYSFSGGTDNRIDSTYIRLSVLTPDLISAIIAETLVKIERSFWYLHNENGLYWFSHFPTLTKIIIDVEETISDEKIKAKISHELPKLIGTALNPPYMFPTESKDIADLKKISLVVIQLESLPKIEEKINEFIQNYSTSFRIYKNSVIFLVPDKNEVQKVINNTRRVLALRKIKETNSIYEALSETQKADLEERIEDTKLSLPQTLCNLYRIIVKLKGNKIVNFDMGIFTYKPKETLSKKVREFLIEKEIILEQIDSKFIESRIIGEETESIQTINLYESFYKDAYLPLIESETILKKSLAIGIKEGYFGYAFKEGDEFEGLRFYETIKFDKIIFSENYYIIRKDIAHQIKDLKRKAEYEEIELKELEIGKEPEIRTEKILKPDRYNESEILEELETPEVFKKFYLKAEIPWENFSSLISGVIQPLKSQNASITIKIEIEAENEKGFNEAMIDLTIKETLNQIKAKINKLKLE